MSPISGNSLLHFTRNMENLKSILENGFWPRYVLEGVRFLNDYSEIAFPMVCFCDIPLSQAKWHIGNYGAYGIGLTKKWGYRKHLNPVLYIKSESELASRIEFIRYSLVKGPDTLGKYFVDDDNQTIGLLGFLSLIKHMKPYEGMKGENNIRFYDEREWRYAPNPKIYNKVLDYYMSAYEFVIENKVDRANQQIKRARLNFEPKDIKYILVERENQIIEMVDYLHDWKRQNHTEDEIKKLTTRIITTQQIEEDF